MHWNFLFSTTSLELILERPPTGLSGLMLQFMVILAVARMVGWLATKVGQPRVVGEMIAGILLGKTALLRLNSFRC